MITQLTQIVQNASNIFKEGYYASKDIEFKAKKDLVTQYDVAVEQYLKKEFQKSFPEFTIVAEESDNTSTYSDNMIIIDPIDGTTNFVNKLPHCAISVGVVYQKKLFCGVVYNPILDELYSATYQKGAFCNGNKLQVSSCSDFEKSLIATGFPYSSASNTDDLNWVIKNMQTVLPKCQDIRRLGSASIDLCMVASGVFEGYYEINLKPWDVSAGILILQEAGGMVTNDKKEPYKLFEDKCIVASNKTIHEELVRHLS